MDDALTPPEVLAEAPAELDRAQRRFLKRLYNGRTLPVMVDGRAFLTYREASRYLLTLHGEARAAAYAGMKAQDRAPRR